MSVLERLYSLEIEFYRLFRAETINAMEAAAVHTSYALQHGYEPLLYSVGTVDSSSLTDAKDRMMGMGTRATCRPPTIPFMTLSFIEVQLFPALRFFGTAMSVYSRSSSIFIDASALVMSSSTSSPILRASV